MFPSLKRERKKKLIRKLPSFFRVKCFLIFKSIYKWFFNIPTVKYCISYQSISGERHNSEPHKTSKMELFMKIVHGYRPSTIFVKSSNFDVCLGSECASKYSKPLSTFSKNQTVDFFGN